MNKSDAFGEIGMAYAERFADLEGARTTFLQERDAVLAELRARLDQAVRAASLPSDVSTPKRGDSAVWATATSSAYTAARMERGRKGAAGVQFELRPLDAFKLPDKFGFVASAWFTMGQPQLNRLRTDGDPLAGQVAYLAGAVVYVPYRIVAVGTADTVFDRAMMFETIEPTVDLFCTLDAALGAAVRREPTSAAAEEDAG